MFGTNGWWRNQQSILREAQKDVVKAKIEVAFARGDSHIEIRYLLEETRQYFQQMGVCFCKCENGFYKVYSCK